MMNNASVPRRFLCNGCRWMITAFLLLGWGFALQNRSAAVAEVTTRNVRQALETGAKYLLGQQRPDGSFPADEVLTHPVGVTCLATLALQELPLTGTEAAISRAWNYLHQLDGLKLPTHELAMLILAGLDSEQADAEHWLLPLVTELQQRQQADGSWGTLQGDVETGLRISYLAVLALREAALAGFTVPAETWQGVRNYWLTCQNPDGSWGTIFEKPLLQQEVNHLSLAGRTRQALGTLAICREMLQQLQETAELSCCTPAEKPHPAEQKGQHWLSRELAGWSEQQQGQNFLQYHLYALEKTGDRFSLQFSDEQDWYQSGSLAILLQQNRRQGYWEGNNRIVSTSYALLFLAKAIKPVLAQKWRLATDSTAGDDHSGSITPVRHPHDLVRLTNWLTTLPEWPGALNCQEIQLAGKTVSRGLQQLLQAPVLYVTGEGPISYSPKEVEMLQQYVQMGGVLIGAPVCQNADFELSFRRLVAEIAPQQGSLERLADSHPVYWMEFPLAPAQCELWGLDAGCRTAVFYCPLDFGCHWSSAHQISALASEELSSEQKKMALSLQLGANLLSYATSKQVYSRFDIVPLAEEQGGTHTDPPRGAFEIAQLQLSSPGLPDASEKSSESRLLKPVKALENMVRAGESAAGIPLFLHPYQVSLQQDELFRFPFVYCHGSRELQLTNLEKAQLRTYLEHGGVLFCDACCGSSAFDRSFRQLMKELFPETPLTPISAACDLFSEQIGYDLQGVEFRKMVYDPQVKQLQNEIQTVQPLLEGIRTEAGYRVFYSPYDLSCALENVSRISCAGYTPESAIKIATNVLLYSLLQ